MGEGEISQFLTALAVNGHVSASTQNQALCALLFLYRHGLDLNLGWLDDVVRAKWAATASGRADPARGQSTAGGSGGGQLAPGQPAARGWFTFAGVRVKEDDCSTHQLVVREGKGNKDRVTLSATRSPRACSKTVTTYERFRNCLGIER